MGTNIVLVHGCFDGLHKGHIRLLEMAKALGTLVVSVTDDPFIKKNKGPAKPVFPLEHRMAVLEACRYVDLVVPCYGTTGLPSIDDYSPCVYVKGLDTACPDPEGPSMVVRAARGEFDELDDLLVRDRALWEEVKRVYQNGGRVRFLDTRPRVYHNADFYGAYASRLRESE